MLPTRQGSFRLFRFLGIDVYLHWSWFLVAVYEIQQRTHHYGSATWNALEYLALFGIVLLHEFGHALACRQVGGQANQIVLWPLGGVAYVAPPQRPGATLWSIAAGPLVNVALFPFLTGLLGLSGSAGWSQTAPDLHGFIQTVWLANTGLLIFNLLPIYPLDGGQILRSLLWFPFGRARSLMLATVTGFAGVAGLAVLALLRQSFWIGIMCVFVMLNCWSGWVYARALLRVAKAPRREGFFCPHCGAAPPRGAFWGCGNCRRGFDTFETQASCPHCQTQYAVTMCLECGKASPFSSWNVPPATQPKR
jgi:Zn-dependent protease